MLDRGQYVLASLVENSFGISLREGTLTASTSDLLCSQGKTTAKCSELNDKITFELTTFFCTCLLYTSPSPRDLSTSRMPSSACKKKKKKKKKKTKKTHKKNN
eukprot:TRINITY_DN7879_c0_g1_i9.p1 TRINITY_DN7879_c0_g1~~TRINITY_DN7879_c0_g1_i9.p1  ORF type:complete len:103 (-),score=25.16 TRINITY_DN7879_c0_g1_i9:13-321(-)